MTRKITKKRRLADAEAQREMVKIRAARRRETERLLAREFAYMANRYRSFCIPIYDSGFINQWPESVIGKEPTE